MSDSKRTETKSPPPNLNRTSRSRWPALAALVAGLTFAFKLVQYQSHDYTICSSNGAIYTVNPDLPNVQCILVKDSVIADVGNLEDISARHQSLAESILPWPINLLRSSPPIKYINSTSAIVPGLADAHGHILEYGFKENLDLTGCQSVQEVLDRLKAYVSSHPDILKDPSQWILGMGWDQTKWLEARYPTADDLDSDMLLRGRRISLSRVDGHATWVSNRVLQLLGDLPKEVDGGVIIRDTGGKPTGIFVDNAMELIKVPPWTQTQMLEYFDKAVKDAHAHGLTSIHDAMSTLDNIVFFKEYSEEKHLPLRLYLMGHVSSNEYWGGQIPRLTNHGINGRLNVRSVKLFSDGALGSFGAALLEPYSDNPSTSGIMRVAKETLGALINQFYKDGWQVNVHCIGDRANHMVLDIFEDIHAHNSSFSQARNRIEHAQIMTLEDLERVGRLGVIPSVQPTHATSDMGYAEQRLGPERIKGAYAYQTLLQNSQNHVLPLGSDFPVEGINPLLGFYAAVARLSVTGDSPHGVKGWYPGQKLTRTQALKGMTLDAAYASFAEDKIGSLEIGKRADFVILDRDIMKVPQSEILGTKVQATVIDGQVVYGEL
ncbi:hypothetical protein CONPUDRAFT_139452 [Coniophora puteana RWD-64-598 SS2]|uniref:Amidohydrolase 3 domain-containing protein n=1 Tax=Coniophora puteana (strain RWD-64-598) TaxID=741705 RepID=A0A5M3MBW8_CONPW|nr:uncharacterized protein CONPUDRAFT_139452 [Coniophora puteana RWD-64-598 SS2]EIW76728.1 hypothetical protein CONPUDRAFT_139452 [Coniophora puteana RWD-64-598 SS2]